MCARCGYTVQHARTVDARGVPGVAPPRAPFSSADAPTTHDRVVAPHLHLLAAKACGVAGCGCPSAEPSSSCKCKGHHHHYKNNSFNPMLPSFSGFRANGVAFTARVRPDCSVLIDEASYRLTVTRKSCSGIFSQQSGTISFKGVEYCM